MIAALLICLAPVPNDGDTARCGTSRVTVRLYGVKSVDGSALDGEAKEALILLADGGWTCKPAPTGPVTSYSRLVAQCFNHRGLDVGAELIRRGKAAEDCSFTKTRAYPRGFYGNCGVVARPR